MPRRYVTLSIFYFLYFSGLGIYIPYWGPYLRDLGFDLATIGVLIAATLINHMFAPYFWGWVADKTHAYLYIIRLAAIMVPICFSLVLVNQSFYYLITVLFVLGFFWHALLPQVEVLTMSSLRHKSNHYSSIRLWGSLGFTVSVIGLAPAINYYGISIVPWVLVGTLLLLGVVTFRITSHRRPAFVATSIMTYLYRPEILSLFALCFLIQLSHGPYYTFFSIYLSEHNYSNILIGPIWAFGTITEIGMFLFMYKILSKFNPSILLLICLLATAIRWILIAYFVDSLVILLLAQSLHAISFGVYHATAIYLVNSWFGKNAQGRGQALYTAVNFGAGGALGSYLSGQLWDQLGSTKMFLLASCIAFIAIPLIIPIYRRMSRNRGVIEVN